MPDYLLPLSVLHAAAPGVLDVVLGPDGACPRWGGPCWSERLTQHVYVGRSVVDGWYDCARVAEVGLPTCERFDLALDLLTPSTACRIAGLCLRAGGDEQWPADLDLCWEIIAEAMDNRIHPETATRMVALTLRLAPKIAALKVLQ